MGIFSNNLTYDVAVVGATGAVGTMMLSILQERNFPVGRVYPLASARSRGKTVVFNGQPLIVEDVADFDFAKTKLALFSAGSEVSAQYAPKAAKLGCVVIDNTSYFRREPNIPLVIAEVNPDDLKKYRQSNIIANPNCSTIQMLVALKPLYDVAGIRRINVATYQSVSGTGQRAIEELLNQTRQILEGKKPHCEVYPHPIAFNVLPHIDDFQENGYTREEMKMVWETQKILGDEKILVNPTTVRVPVLYGHAEAVHIETKIKLTASQAREILLTAPGVGVIDDPKNKEYPTPVTHGAGKDLVFVGRIREDISHPNGLNLWVVADNIRKGAALNTIQIAEILVQQGRL
jgi:aspartate-semialdehyde dehydrogenase